jgi:hypothetical protein
MARTPIGASSRSGRLGTNATARWGRGRASRPSRRRRWQVKWPATRPTKGEHSLIRNGKGDLVLETRRAYQDSMGDELSAGVEDITGRKVIAFLSANHLEPDIAIESFILAPVDG